MNLCKLAYKEKIFIVEIDDKQMVVNILENFTPVDYWKSVKEMEEKYNFEPLGWSLLSIGNTLKSSFITKEGKIY